MKLPTVNFFKSAVKHNPLFDKVGKDFITFEQNVIKILNKGNIRFRDSKGMNIRI